MQTLIVFIDRDGTVNPEVTPMRAMAQFRDAAFGRSGYAANRHLQRLVRRGAKLVWNSRNPDPVVRRNGRLHSFNERRFADPAAEHVKLLKMAGIPDEWFLPEFPEVIHCRTMTKGQSMMAFCKDRGIAVENTVAFDNEIGQMIGYPADRVIAVDSNVGISKENCDHALVLLNLVPPTAGPSGTPPQTPPLP